MLSLTDKNLLQFIPDYPINLIAPASLSNEDFTKLHTELRALLKYLKYSNNREMLKNIIHEDSAYKNISRKTAELLRIMTHSDIHFEKGKERINMCQAIEDMKNAAREQY